MRAQRPVATIVDGGRSANRLVKNGECRGAKPLCRELRVSLLYNFFPFLTPKGAKEPALSIVEGDGRKSFSAPRKVFFEVEE